MKRAIYIVCFVFLGILLSSLAHGLVEIWYINLLLRDFDFYGFGLSWRSWELIHHLGAALLWVAGAAFGFWQGNYWWPKLYDTAGELRSKWPLFAWVGGDTTRRT